MFVKFMTMQKEPVSSSPTKPHFGGKDKENRVDNTIHSADEDEARASVAISTKEGTAINTEISPVCEGGDLVDSFLDFDGIVGTEDNAQLAAAEVLAEISSPKSDSGANKKIEDSRVGTEVKDAAAPVRQPQSKGSIERKGSPSNHDSPKAEGGEDPEIEPKSDPYSLPLPPNAEQKPPPKGKVTSEVS